MLDVFLQVIMLLWFGGVEAKPDKNRFNDGTLFSSEVFFGPDDHQNVGDDCDDHQIVDDQSGDDDCSDDNAGENGD